MKKLALTLLVIFLLVGVFYKVDNRLVLTNKTQGNKQMATSPLNTLQSLSLGDYPAAVSGKPSSLVFNENATVQGAGTTTPSYQQPTQQTYVDPYASYGGTAAYNNLVSGFDAQKQNVFGSANDAASAYGQKYNNSILNFLDNQGIGQKNIDTQAQKNQLAKMQGVNGILAMVGQGIQSGGVQLANRNAGDSSGGEAIARAYGQLGNQQMANVGNQYQLGQQDVQNSQDAFNIQQQMGVRDLQSGKQDAINQITNDARTQLAQIDAAMANANLPQRIQLDQARQQVQNSAIQALQQYDQTLTSGVGAIKPMGADQVRAGAATMASAGYDLGNNAFNYTTEAPAQFQNTGPSPSALPVYSNQYGKKQTA